MKALTIQPFVSSATLDPYFVGDVYEGEPWQVEALEAQGLVERIGGAAKSAPSPSADEPEMEPKPKGKRATTRRATTAKRGPGRPRKTAG